MALIKKTGLSTIRLLGLSFCLLPLRAPAVTIALSPTQDSAIFQEVADNSNGAGEFLVVGTRFGAHHRRSLLLFDVAAVVPAGATINSAVLTLQFTTPRNWGSFPVSLHRMTTAWGEAGSIGVMGQGFGAPALSGDATWSSNIHGGSNWNTLGGDFTATASATQFVDGNGAYDWNSTTGSVADVQLWLDNPSQNFGWIIVGDEITDPGAATAKRFHSRENATDQPTLVIDFTPVPEPSSLLLVLGGLGILVRRKR